MPASAPDLANSCILVVDDNPANLALVTAVLEATRCRILLAEGATQAQSILREVVPDLILMDIALPGMDGLTLTRRLKADARLQHVPVIALTAFAMDGDERKAREAGCDGYITKPIDTQALPVQVANALQRAAQQRSAARD
ncbi:MAG TPA: response regulator [Ideonella sp.]|uniref:response regulator n=1 Tax=Ideonella sp. TaxID=1929293 RepID=UPI002E33D1BA|nr:response regulator [Ideonella sp.]HEX5685726.1 response regulator [Ideonella sp.]